MNGVIAAGSTLTAEAGAEMYRQGGNAIDAGVAAAFMAFVVETAVVNVGGSGFGLIATPDFVQSYDFFSTMPSGSVTSAMDFKEIVVDFGGDQQSFHIGRGATAVPGAVKGLCQMAAEKGTLPLEKLLQPAIEAARKGFPAPPNMGTLLNLLDAIYRDTDKMYNTVAPKGHYPKPDETVRFPQLADTLEMISKQGPDWFYQGDLAKAMVADHAANGGLITAEDLANYHVVTSEPIKISYRDYEILLTPPASSGGVLIAMALKLLESQSLENVAPGSSEHLCLLTHVMDLANVARKDWDKHRETWENPIEAFLSEERIDHLQHLLADRLKGRQSPPDQKSSSSLGSTTHISAMDAAGNAVSITLSTGEASGYLIGDTGVAPNNMLGEEDLNPHGFHQSQPGERLISMMTPVVVLKDSVPIMALGSAGSNRIRSAILQVLCNVLDFGTNPQQAIDKARIHVEAGVLQAEPGYDLGALKHAAGSTFRLNAWKDFSLFFGGAQAAAFIEGELLAGADARRFAAWRKV
jgi:gamma-glutamyltranspeptidase/glutathione hydrolase